MALNRIHLPVYLCFMYLAVSDVFALSPPDDLINNIQCQGVFGLNFTQAGSREQIAYFVINSNSATGFDVTFKFANFAKFINGNNEIPMTALVLNKVSGTLGEGLTEPNEIDVLDKLNGGDEYIWNPGTEPSSETVNFIIDLNADWDDPLGKMAGFYFETITVTISVGL
mgnify:CR=1 FL=1